MPSPFPGMNPYLEQGDVWHDFHKRLVPAAAEEIGALVRPDYIVKIDEHMYVHELPAPPAVGIAEAPARVRLPARDFEREGFIEIRDRRSRELVCVVEVLSPSNKQRGADRQQYLAKRARVLNSPAHLVEIDLLRGGEPMPSDDRPPFTYSVMVSRAEDRPEAGFWSIRLPDRLPEIPIPLRPPHADVRLDLQALLHRVYGAGTYELEIYEGLPSPPVDPETLAWCRQFLPAPPA